MDSRTGLSSASARASASGPHGYQSTGLWACCNRYGLVSCASRFATLLRVPSGGVATREDDLPWDATPFLPGEADRSLPRLKQAADGCRGCDLFRTGTQTVFGDGPPRAQVMFIGEQPGDQEDRAGKPFVGPAGRLQDEGLHEVGIR